MAVEIVHRLYDIEDGRYALRIGAEEETLINGMPRGETQDACRRLASGGYRTQKEARRAAGELRDLLWGAAGTAGE